MVTSVVGWIGKYSLHSHCATFWLDEPVSSLSSLDKGGSGEEKLKEEVFSKSSIFSK